MSLEVSALRAFAHPLRLRMLSLLTGEAMSASEIARQLDVTSANASYHLRFLAAAGLVDEAGQESIRGGVAKRYRHYPAARPQRTAKDDPKMRLVWQAMAHELIRRAEQQKPGESRLCDAELWVDPEVWREAHELADRAAALLHDRARPPGSPGAVHVNASIAMFEMTP